MVGYEIFKPRRYYNPFSTQLYVKQNEKQFISTIFSAVGI